MSGLTSATSNRAAAICEIGINLDNQGIQPKSSVGWKSKKSKNIISVSGHKIKIIGNITSVSGQKSL